MASPKFPLSFAIAYSVIVLIGSLTKTVKIKFSKTKATNLLTLKAYYILLAFISFKILLNSKYLSENRTSIMEGNEWECFDALII